MPADSIAALRAVLMHPQGEMPEAYREKQIHEIPDAPVLNRAETLTMLARNEVVLDIGGSGPMHDQLVKVAKDVMVWDKTIPRLTSDTVNNGVRVEIDLDDVSMELPKHDEVTLIIAGEVLEHLANPGHFLSRLKAVYPTQPKVFTVPNAFSASGRKWVGQGIENVNRDHVAYYSWKTLHVLLGRYGYRVSSWGWYNGQARTAEGLIAVTE